MEPEPEFRLMPEQASTPAPLVDGVFWELNALTIFFTILIAGLLLYFAVKYRRRSDEIPQPVAGSLRLELFWTGAPLLIVLYLFWRSTSVYFTMITPPADTMPDGGSASPPAAPHRSSVISAVADAHRRTPMRISRTTTVEDFHLRITLTEDSWKDQRSPPHVHV